MLSKKKIGITLALILCAVVALEALGPAGIATTPALAKPLVLPASAPVVNPDGTVTLSLKAPQATSVILNWQNMVGRSPAADPYPMTKGADGVWTITMGPNISPNNLDWVGPNWYGYAFIVDGVQVADPANRDFSLFQAPPLWAGFDPSAWSMVMAPGAGTEYMANDPAVPHGAVAKVHYVSKLAQTEQEMMVYTPPGYNHDNRVYPVFYLYHGGGGIDTDWPVNMRAGYIMDNLIAQGKAVPMIVVMPEYQVRLCSNFEDTFPQELLGSIVPYIEQNYRVAPGGKNRALAGLSSGGGCVMNTFFWDPGAFAYIGDFSANWTAQAQSGLVQNHPELLTDPAINKDTKLLWISRGGLEGSQNFLPLLDQYGIKYTWVPGSTIGANYGHVWDTWRHHLLAFAPLLFM